ncbi:MAG: riboflavin synthase [Rhodospirillaceae bacterium TMED8]|nr:riboflavin synthase [Magnetovibrio sp.]OUT51998.1 MAG: riboflavin synthase [Rhodospirillaceae bacterium TMED8]|tara:strand:- start:67 stop:657 length:591 start_codon:yes stop_codon:yes gene_type:complete
MFTGITTDIGEVIQLDTSAETRVAIATSYGTGDIKIGASICCSGVCLTVVETGSDWFGVQVSLETISKTTLECWRIGTKVNLERALKVGDELGGHIVSGHVDGVGKIQTLKNIGGSIVIQICAPPALGQYLAVKGSITIDGVSLTVNEVKDSNFEVNIIPHTQSATTIGDVQIGDMVNLEIDMLARYVARLHEFNI